MASRPLEKVLVANRGEIARRILRTVRAMGLAGVAVYSDADEAAPHVAEADEAVRLGPAPSRESYLDADRVVAAARATGADAVHPGYGFLSENPVLAERCARAGLVFVGPPAGAIRAMGSKIEAKARMEAAGVPVVPGFATAGMAPSAVAAEAAKLGFPVLVKASAGGGGRGMRVARDPADLAEALESAQREAESAFGDGTLLVERCLVAPRHVEVQVLADAAGHTVHLFERECSVQRRHQKLVEEAPSVAVDAALRERMGAAAVAAARAIGYVGAGTVEFLLDASGGFHFLEMNTRLQVEHPVTEAITGLDLVRLQIDVARGLPLPFTQEGIRASGHAIEVRLYAEDPSRDFLPSAGRIALWEPPALPGLRVDAGVEAGSEVSLHYDALLAKLIAHGATREEARTRLARGLRALGVAGVATNRALLCAVLEHPAFAAGETDTGFLDRHLPPEARADAPDPGVLARHAAVAALHAHARRRAAGGPLPASLPSGWRNNRWRAQEVGYRAGEAVLAVRYVAGATGRFALELDADGHTRAGEARVGETDAEGLVLEWDGVRRRYRVVVEGPRTHVHGPDGTSTLEEQPRFPDAAGEELSGGCVAPMTGVVRELRVAAGDRVEAGTVLLVLEAMKMEHALRAHAKGVVAEVRVEVGQSVDPDQVLVVVEAEE